MQNVEINKIAYKQNQKWKKSNVRYKQKEVNINERRDQNKRYHGSDYTTKIEVEMIHYKKITDYLIDTQWVVNVGGKEQINGKMEKSIIKTFLKQQHTSE